MRFVKKDAAKQLIDVIHKEQSALGALQKRLDGIKPKWFQLDRECAEVEALLNARIATYTRPAEVFFRDHEAMLVRERDAKIAERDALTGSLPADIQTLGERIFRRLSFVSGALSHFAGIVLNHHLGGGSQLQGSPELREQLEGARREVEKITDVGRLIEFIGMWIERVENEEGLQLVPLANLDQAIAQALSVGQEQPSPAAGG